MDNTQYEQIFDADRLSKMYLMSAAVLFPLTLIMIIITQQAISLAPGSTVIFLLFMGLWRKKTPLVSIADDHMIISVAPARGKQVILFSEIDDKKLDKNRLRIYYRKHNKPEKSKTALIELNAMTTPYRQPLIDAIEAKIQAAHSTL
ncbi:MAG: hypothetical protein ACTMIA_08840 [Vibrio sp.]